MNIRKKILRISDYHAAKRPAEPVTAGQMDLVRDFNQRLAGGKVRLESVRCICGAETFDLIASIDRYSVLQKTVICPRCGLIQSNPRMTADEYRSFYSSDFYRRCYEGERYMEAAESRYDNGYGSHIFKEITKIKKIDGSTSVLEIGSGGGWNLTPFINSGAKAAGVDYSASLVELGKRHGINIAQGDIDSVTGRYDIIIANHALEHMPDPVGFLRKILGLMCEDGILYIGVPNILNFGISQLQNAHTYYFTPNTLRRICASAGFETVARGTAQRIHMFSICKRSVSVPGPAGFKNDYNRIRFKLLEVSARHILKTWLSKLGIRRADIVQTAIEIKKVVYIVESFFSKRDYERYGLDLIKENGLQAQVWDFTPFLYPKLHAEVKIKDPVAFEGLKVFSSRKDALNAISRLDKDAFIVNCLFYDARTVSIFRAISKTGLRYGMFVANAIPPARMRSGLGDVLKRLRRITFKKIRNRIFFSVPFYLRGIRPATFLLTGGKRSKSVFTYYPIDKTTHTVWMHALDYDIYLNLKAADAGTGQKTGVFLDEDVCFHPEYIQRAEAPYSTADEYFKLLRGLFDSLERRHGIKIVIAAHPRSRYEDYGDFFGGRAVIKWNTAELVKRSLFVMAHSSTSVNFAALFKKPVVFVTTDDLNRSPQGTLINVMASYFNKTPINLNSGIDIDLDRELKLDENAYARYKEDYIKVPSSPDKPAWQIFVDSLRGLSGEGRSA